jgi:hypothetical protein
MVTKISTNLVIDYDTQLLLPLMVVSYKLLMPTTIVESNQALASQMNSKDFFKTTKTNPNTLKHPISKKFNRFHNYPVDVDCKFALN